MAGIILSSRSMSKVFSLAEIPTFFFKPVQFHLESSDLAVELLDKKFLVFFFSLSFVGKELQSSHW